MGVHGQNQLSLCWLRSQERNWGLRPREFSAEPAGGLAFYAPDFALSTAKPWLVGESAEFDFPVQALPALEHRAEPEPASFAKIFENIQSHIATGQFEKVVPIVGESLEFANELNPAMFAPAIFEPRPNQYNYGFSFEGEGLVGVTPELLFQVEGRHLKTMALAGTGRADGPSLLENKKERFEHQLVIDHIASELKRFGSVDVGTTTEKSYGVLKHLHTPIEMKLAEAPNFMQLVVALHPTAALGGWPRRPAIEWLEAQNFHVSRRRFGAPFGVCAADEMICVVAIRGLQWRGTRADLFSGAGIVRQSEAISEWNELALKRRAIAKSLGLGL